MHNNFYLHHLCVEKQYKTYIINTPIDILENHTLENHTLENQSDGEIENDILEIQSIIQPKKLIIVSHYNAKLNGDYTESRNELISLLKTICGRHNITFINPSNILSKYPQNCVMENNLTHYTVDGKHEFTTYMENFSINIFQKFIFVNKNKQIIPI
jgi:hypothetical protein